MKRPLIEREADEHARDPTGPAAGERPSKSERKREMSALQDLGESLVRLGADQLARIDLP
ncbi:MAG: DUF615 domain-containing protein, partial [Gemmatimonadota bacterium]